ncbi:hypothetical protein ACLOJK_011752 [Asimina triloba]
MKLALFLRDIDSCSLLLVGTRLWVATSTVVEGEPRYRLQSGKSQSPHPRRLAEGFKKIVEKGAHFHSKIGNYPGAVRAENKEKTREKKLVEKGGHFRSKIGNYPGAVYRKFYTEEKEKSNGVLAIHVLRAAVQPYISMANIIHGLGYNGIGSLLGLMHTEGTIPDALPPLRSVLVSSFMIPHHSNVRSKSHEAYI